MIDAELIQHYLDGELDESTTQELSQWLLLSAENRALFRREIALAAALVTSATAQPAHSLAPAKPIAPAKTVARRSDSSTRTRTNTSPRTISARHFKKSQRSRVASRLFIFAATAATIVISAILFLRESSAPPSVPTPPTPTLAQPAHDLLIKFFHGSVSVVRNNSVVAPLPTTLQPGDQVRLGSQATAELTMDQGRTHIWAGSDTNLVIAAIKEPQEQTGTKINLTSGTVLIEAAPQPTNAPLRIHSPRCQAKIVGTVLSFSSLPDRDRIVVGHGVVDCSLPNQGQQTRLTAGNVAESDGFSLTTSNLGYQPPTAMAMARVTGFSLVDGKTGTPIAGYTKLESGCVIDCKKLSGRTIHIRAEVTWTQTNEGEVHFHFLKKESLVNQVPPYVLSFDLPPFGSLNHKWPISDGIHSLVATPYSGPYRKEDNDQFPNGVKDQPGHSATLIFTVINSSP